MCKDGSKHCKGSPKICKDGSKDCKDSPKNCKGAAQMVKGKCLGIFHRRLKRQKLEERLLARKRTDRIGRGTKSSFL